ncbi:MAG: hypothetical protein ACYCOO_07745 [Chitinophagaceae bacterium]
MLELPPTLRFPLPHELSHRTDLERELDPAHSPGWREGYRLIPNKTLQLPFKFSAEININNSRLWKLVLALSDHLPEQICCEYGLEDEQGRTTGYFPKSWVIQSLSLFQDELTQDGSLWFSLLSLSREALIEIKVTSTKYLQCSLNNSRTFIQGMEEFKLPERKDLVVRDEFPLIVEPLKLFLPDSRSPQVILSLLDRTFLPAP